MSNSLLRWMFPHDLHHVAGLHQIVGRAVPAKGRILDLGCGRNTDLACYRAADCEVWGTDFQSHPGLQHAEWFRPLRGDGSIPFPNAHFDTVVSVMVLEHVEAPYHFFHEVSRVLRAGGRFIGHSISGTHYVTILRRLFGLLPHSVNQAIVKTLYNRPGVDTFPAYYRANTQKRLQWECTEAGLNLLDFQRYADPGYFRFAKPIEACAVLADRFLDTLHPGWGRLYFTMIAEKPGRVETEQRSPELAPQRRKRHDRSRQLH